jgi:CNT family concentrative nucleoside transporter
MIGMGLFLGQIVYFFVLRAARGSGLARARNAVGATAVAAACLWMYAKGLYGQDILSTMADFVGQLLTLAGYGARFLFGNLADPQYFFPADPSSWPGFGYQFAFFLLPVIIFFAALTAVLYYLGWIQSLIESIARFMRWTLGTSGAETLCAAANIFIGQTESPLIIRPYLTGLTRSELVSVMVAGFGTVSAGSIAAYIAMGIPGEHLLAASLMSAPAALVISKIIYPETQHSQTAGDVGLPRIDVGDNVIEAATNGITDGLKLAVNVAAMLVGFISLIAVVDLSLNWVDAWVDGRLLGGELVARSTGGISPVVAEYVGIVPGSMQTLFGTAFKPVAWIVGVPWQDASSVGALLGIQLSLNEFVGYTTMAGYMRDGVLGPRAIILATYMLCGFANFGSVGIQIGGLAALMPGRKTELAKVGLRAMLGGALTSLLTAAVAGVLL